MAKSYYMPEVEKEVAEVEKQLLSLYSRLCELDYLNGSISQPSGSLYDNFMTFVKKSEALKLRIEGLKKISQALKEGNTRFEDLTQEITSAQKSIDLLYSRLGAILWEESVGGDIDGELLELSPQMGELQRKLRALLEKSNEYDDIQKKSGWAGKTYFQLKNSVVKSRLRGTQKKQDALFVSLGRVLVSEGRTDLLKSEATGAILEEYETSSQRLETLSEEREMIQQTLHHNKNTLEKEEGRASVQHRINDLSHEYREVMKQRKEAASSYGRFISTGIDLSSPTLFLPDEIAECQKEILEQQELKKELLLMIKQLTIEKKIEEQVLLIRQDEEHIAHIEDSIGQLNRQIEEVRKEMQGKQDQISHLQGQLRKLLPDQGEASESSTG